MKPILILSPLLGDPREGRDYVAMLVLPHTRCSHYDMLPPWGLSIRQGDVAILICLHHGDSREGKVEVATLILPHHGHPGKAWVM